jgi:chloramphenicol 3-O phosphotransferase
LNHPITDLGIPPDSQRRETALEAREQARGDRAIGLARGQIDLVHREVTYDLRIDTVAMSPQQAAEAICAEFGL